MQHLLKIKQFNVLAVFVFLSSFAQAQIAAVSETQPEAYTVSVEESHALVFYPLYSAPASVLSLNDSQIPAEISAVVTSINVRVGDVVQSGDLLAELDCRQTALNYQIEAARQTQLSNSLDLERRELARRETLIAGGNIGQSAFERSQNDVLTQESQLLAQQAMVEIAELNVERCKIKAPYAGVVSARLANVGENLAIGGPVVQLVELDNLDIVANIGLSDLASFTQAQAYAFEMDDEYYPLQLRSLLPVIENNARIRQARFTFANTQAVAGSSGRLVWETPQAHIPARFLQLRDNVPGIFIAENNQAKFVALPNAEEGRPVPFDVNGARLLITDGRFGLVDGQSLNIR